MVSNVNVVRLLMPLAVTITLVGCGTSKSQSEKGNSIQENTASNHLETYEQAVNDFQEVTPQNIDEFKQNSTSTFVFFGRPTCPYCRQFAPMLGKSAKTAKIKIHYLNTQDTESDQSIRDIRSEYDVNIVPTLVHLNKDGSHSKYDRAGKVQLDSWLRQMENQ